MTLVVRVEVISEGEGWRVAYRSPAGEELAPPRLLPRIGSEAWSFPLPPAAEAAKVPADAPHHALCVAADEEPLLEALATLQAREQGSDIVVAMGRYLFAVLLGDAWPTLFAEVGQDRDLRLELQWSPDDAVFWRFPWEMLNDGGAEVGGAGFLALRSGVTVVRRVESPAETLAPATSPLEVLFVVGRALRDDVIRPAAEYLCLVQNLRALGLDRRLRPRLLLEATTETLEAALAERRPAVVHFMTHGHFDGVTPFLELRSSQGQGGERLFAPNLLQLLGQDDSPLPIVVLSACDTASAREALARAGDAASPFAAALVAGGVPLAVGMSGPVSDLACRLFTRAFYGALLAGQDAVAATAAGRRAAVEHGQYDPLAAYDWALPAALVSSRLESACLEIEEPPLSAELQALAHEIEPRGFPIFCDRLPLLSNGEVLLAGEVLQRRLRRGAERQVLALSTAEDARVSDRDERFGRTWTLRALAARAALAGHVPLLVSADFPYPDEDPPGTWRQLLRAFEVPLDQLRAVLGLRGRFFGLSEFLLGGKRPAELPKELQDIGQPAGEPKPLDLARALRHDLVHLLEAVRSRLPEERRESCRLLLLIDDLHRMGELAGLLLKYAFGGPIGLRSCRREVRVAFTWARHGRPYQSTIQHIVDWLGEASADVLSLDRFENEEERLAYQQFLLHYRQNGKARPLAPALETPRNQGFVDTFFSKVSERVGGVPSRLLAAEDVIDIYLGLPVDVLVDARDEDVVERWLEGGGLP